MAGRRSISVVIPTRGRPGPLGRCLDALACQSIPIEVVVAEDASGEGPAAARNAGAARAIGDIVLFTDDDCAPDREWATRLSAACPVGGAAAGETVTADDGDAFAAASQLLTSELQRASLRADGTLGFAPTSNLAVSRSLLERVPFDESFPAAAGEDRDWCGRVAALGAPLRYEPTAIVRHHQALGLDGFTRQQFRYGRGAARLGRAGGPLAGRRVRRRLVAAAFRAGPKTGLLALGAQGAVAAGFVTERLRI
jgi:glycosyltransferase involved in cell wall biosynthesis